jgi:Fe-S-cluster-containing hydrogenase component 2
MILEMADCGGCRTCELVCGYHHTGQFNPNRSSLHIINRDDGKPGYFIEINLFDVGDSPGCDGCIDLDTPMCVSYCHQDLDLLEMVKKVIEEKNAIRLKEK